MKFLKDLFKRKEKPQENILDIKPLIDEFIKRGIPNSLKSEKVIKNAGFILNTLFKSKGENINQMKVMALVFEIRKRIGMSKEAISDTKRLIELFLKFMDKKGLITEEMKNKMNEMNLQAGFPPETIRRENPKIGRNSPCSCGSGKKYKLCCGR